LSPLPLGVQITLLKKTVMQQSLKSLLGLWITAAIGMGASPAWAGKLDATQQEQLQCYVLAGLTSSTDRSRALGLGNFCSSKTRLPLSVKGEMKLGFGEGVQDIAPGFMPPAGPDYAVMPGDKFFWAWQVDNASAMPIDSELSTYFRQNTTVISAHYVKGDMPTGQLPWAQVLGSQDARVRWIFSVDHPELVLQVLQAPPGTGYIVLYLQQRN
jgi:hypothetical protein